MFRGLPVLSLFFGATLVAACSESATTDAAASDTGHADGGSLPDALAADASTTDALAADASAADATPADTGTATASAFSKRFGDNLAGQEAYALAVDSAGNLILAGQFEGTLNFGGGDLTSLGGSDVFVAKLDPAGNQLWAKRFGNNGDFQVGHGVAVDSAGNIVVVGEFEGAIDFGGGLLTSAGGGDIFVVKLDPDGNMVYGKRFGDISDFQVARAVAIDSAGNAIVVGDFDGTADFGSGPLTTAGAFDGFVLKLDPTGALVFVKQFGGSFSEKIATVTVDSADNIVFAGELAGTVDFGGGPLTSAGGADIFVAKLSATGQHVMSKRFGDNARRQKAVAVAVDSGDNLLLGASFEGTVNFGGSDLTNQGASTFDIGIAKLDPGGNHVFSKSFGDTSGQNLISLATAGDDHVFLAGQFRGSVDFGGGALTAGPYVMFLAELDATGGYVSAKKLGDEGGDFIANALVTNDTAHVLVAGRFYGTIDFGSGNLTTDVGDYDVFVARVPR